MHSRIKAIGRLFGRLHKQTDLEEHLNRIESYVREIEKAEREGLQVRFWDAGRLICDAFADYSDIKYVLGKSERRRILKSEAETVMSLECIREYLGEERYALYSSEVCAVCAMLKGWRMSDNHQGYAEIERQIGIACDRMLGVCIGFDEARGRMYELRRCAKEVNDRFDSVDGMNAAKATELDSELRTLKSEYTSLESTCKELDEEYRALLAEVEQKTALLNGASSLYDGEVICDLPPAATDSKSYLKALGRSYSSRRILSHMF